MKVKPILFIAFVVLSLGSILKASSQPTAGFTVQSAACLGEPLQLINTSTSATNYIWDFCQTDLATSPTVIGLTTLPTPSSFYYYALKIVFSNGVWVGFATNTVGPTLLRLDFNSSLSSVPTVTDLGNFGGVLTTPGALDVVQVGGTWYIFVLNVYQNSVTRLTMGNGVRSGPTLAENLGNLGAPLNTPFGIKIVSSGSSNLLAITNQGSNSIVLVDMGVSFSGSPISNRVISDASIIMPSGIDIISTGLNWYGLVSSFQGGNPVLLNFGSSILNTPTFTSLGAVPNGRETRLVKEGLTYTGFIRSSTNGIYRIQFGNNFSTSTLTNLLGSQLQNDSRSIEIIEDTPNWRGYTIEASTGKLWRMNFLGNCQSEVSIDSSVSINPQGVTYLAPNNYYVKLTAIDQNNLRDAIGKSISISSLNAPTINFSSQNICKQSPVQFILSSNQLISSQNWAFGDGGSSSSSNPSHIYTSASTYPVSLNVTASNGCQNFSQKSLQIFNPPVANFSLPAASPICTNQTYTFANTSTFDVGSSPTWQWSVSGTDVATTQNLNYSIPTAVAQSVALTASIPGCSNQTTQSIPIVQAGPLVNFTAPLAGCLNAPVSFGNTTTGSVTSYGWTFGDGHTSSQTNASNTFANTGSYLVTLTAANAVGCQNSLAKNISIYSNPQPAFAIELPPFSCANSPAQFDNTTPALTDSNIATWAWAFGDAASGTSNQKSPAYTYSSAANYNVSLQATTNFGCTGSVQKSVTILPSPQAAFTTNPACVNQNTQFTDGSSGSIANYQWTVQGILLSGNIPPPYIFKSAGTYPVTLTAYGSNGCNNQITKSLVVPVPPLVDFTVQTPCAGKPSIFQELNPGGADPTTAWNWSFGLSQGSGTGSLVTYTFPISNGYSVTLSTTRQSGCVYSASKNISVYTAPTASFTPSAQAGAAPLNVAFNNTSSLADSSFWQFGDAGKSTSKVSSPTFTYTQLGKYRALLTAVNYNGAYSCPDTVSLEISVVIPHIDLAMKNFSLTKDTSINSSKATVTISNLGNIPFTNPEVDIDLGGGALLKGNLTGVVQPGQSVVQTLGLEIVPQAISYICADVVVANDANMANDKQCLTLTGEDVTFSPYPNPVVGSVNFDWVSSSSENVTVTIYESTGQVVFEQTFQNVPLGLGQLSVNTSSLANGLYLIRFAGARTQQTFRIVVAK